jgi:HAD superfamily phosphatase
MSRMIVFDMDGVLVDVSDSYRETICQTVQHFSGKPVTRELVQEYKNRGGFNNDWLLSQTIARDLGAHVRLDEVARHFNSIFYGGLMQRERWIPRDGLLESLAGDHRLAIFTGRPREEALITLRRFATEDTFAPLVGAEDVTNSKPDPEGLRNIQAAHPGVELVYIGDTVDDARSAAGAGVPFIGVAHPETYQLDRLLDLFRENDAAAVIGDVNLLPEVLPRL